MCSERKCAAPLCYRFPTQYTYCMYELYSVHSVDNVQENNVIDYVLHDLSIDFFAIVI